MKEEEEPGEEILKATDYYCSYCRAQNIYYTADIFYVDYSTGDLIPTCEEHYEETFLSTLNLN